MSVVHQPLRHTHKPRGEDMYAAVYQLGNATIMIDDSYIRTRDPEKIELDNEQVVEAAWAIIDELIEAGEEV